MSGIDFERTFIDQSPLPRVWQVTRGADASLPEVVGWLAEHVALLHEERDRHGAVLLRGLRAVDSPASFAAVLDVIGPHGMDYVGGSAPRSQVHGRVTTGSELPGNYSLALHQEMAYQAQRPDALVLCCLQPAAAEGETTLADARQVTSRIDPQVLARFDAKGIAVHRALPREQVPQRLPRPWPAVFGTEDPEQVERLATERGWGLRWGRNGVLHLEQELLPALRAHARTGQRVWANQLHYHMPQCMIRWAIRDGRQEDAAHLRDQLRDQPEVFDHCEHGDGTRVEPEAAEHVWDVLVGAEVPLRWQPHDVLLVDNVLAMHGRRRYRGERRLFVGLVLDDAPAASRARAEP